MTLTSVGTRKEDTFVRKIHWLGMALALVVAFSLAVTPAFAQSGRVTMLGTWGGQELEAFEKVLEAFTAETGIQVDFTGTRDLVAVLTTPRGGGQSAGRGGAAEPGPDAGICREGALVDLSQRARHGSAAR